MPNMIRRAGVLGLLTLLASGAFPVQAASAGPFASDRITVTAEGTGDDVILLSGLGSSPRIWRELVRAVPNHRYHLVQISGFAGQATRGNATGLVAAPAAEEVARYIGAAGLRRPAVIGHSLGGLVGLMLAARHPQAISKLMVVDVRPFMGQAFAPPGTTAQTIRPVADAFVGRLQGLDAAGWRSQGQGLIAGMIDTVSKRHGALQDWVTSDPDVVVRGMHEAFVTDLGPELRNITVPTVVLYVTMATNKLTDQQTDAVYEAAYRPLAHVSLKHYANSAHYVMWDQPDRFRTEVVDFLR